MTRILNDDRTRMVDDEPALALAAYKVAQIEGEQYQAEHVGIFHSAKDAESWLETGLPHPTQIELP